MKIRRYCPGEELALRKLFFDTIHNINIRDYTTDQVHAWVPAQFDRKAWQERIVQMNPFVCVIDDEITGYASLLECGYVDHFYVHHQRQGEGIGRSLMEAIEVEAAQLGILELTSDVSITARPFFERFGFKVVTEQQVERSGATFRNFKMRRLLGFHCAGGTIL